MFQNFYPNKLIRSVYELNWEELSRTYGGVIFDIDNTLVPHGAAADEAAIQLFARIHNLGMKTMLVSNNGEARVKPFAQQVQTDYIIRRASRRWKATIKPWRKWEPIRSTPCSSVTRSSPMCGEPTGLASTPC